MESFAESIRDSSKSSRLFRALRGRKPYRHFKDEIIYLDLDQAYYAFRSRAFMEIAREWCENYDLPYKLRSEKASPGHADTEAQQ